MSHISASGLNFSAGDAFARALPKGSHLADIGEGQSGLLAQALCHHISVSLDTARDRSGLNAVGNHPLHAVSELVSTSTHIGERLKNAAWSLRDPMLSARIGLDFAFIDLIRPLVDFRSAPVLVSVLKQLCAYFTLFQSDGRLSLSLDRDGALLEYEHRNGLDWRRIPVTELMIATLTRLLRSLLPRPFWPQEVLMSHLGGASPDQATQIFGIPVTFGATSCTAIRIPRTALQHRCLLSDDAERASISLPPETVQVPPYRAFVPSVAFYFRRYVYNPTGGMTTVARHMGMSRASLARRLADQNVTFSDVIFYMMMCGARYYIESTDVPMAVLASRLRYSEHAAFTRAFSRTFGCSPMEYRRLSQSRALAASF